MSLFPLPSRGEPASPGLLATHDSLPSRSSQFRPTLATAFSSLRLSLPLAAILLTAASARAAAAADAASTSDEIVKLDKVTVVEKNDTSGPLSYAGAEKALDRIAGATHIVGSEDFGKGRLATTADIFAYQPGVYAQETAGGDGVKLSVRGSAINRGAGNSYRSGIYIAFDGLPVTVPGGAPYELQEAFSFARTEFLLGANGFEYGPRNFGGAINFVTPTGYDSPRFGLRFEGGSFGYLKGQVSIGAVTGPFDYYASITSTRREGFQTQSRVKTTRIASDFGWKINARTDNRLFFRYGYTFHESPGALTKAKIKSDPESANATNVTFNARRIHPGTYWLGDKLTIRPSPDSSVEIGLLYHHYPIDIYSSVYSAYFYDTGTFQAKYKRSDLFAGHASQTTLAVISSTNINGWYNRYDNNPASAYYGLRQQKNDFSDSADNVVLALNDFELLRSLWLTTGVSAVQTIRKNVNTVGPTSSYRREDVDFAPRLGLRYEFSPDVQVYSNVSRTVEPRNDWAGSTGSYNGVSGPGFSQLDLRNQISTTWEVGTRAKFGIFDGSLSYYRATITDALLSVETFPGSGVTIESNASPTINQGIELGFDTLLWQTGGHRAKPTSQTSRLLLRQSYTWSDFHYRHDAQFGKNRLPGVPENYYQAELLYNDARGFFLGVNVKAASDLFVDYANTATADSWTVLGAQAGYEARSRKWRVYLDLRNLTDEHYTASVSPSFNDHGADLARHTPGDLRSIVAGLELRF